MAHKKNDLMLITTRSLLAFAFLVIGLNDFHGLVKLPHMSAEGDEFIRALKDTGYLFWTLKIVEVVAALALIGGFFVPLTTLFIFPVILNIFLFHVFVEPGWGTVLSILMMACAGYIFYGYREMFKFLWRYNMEIDPNSFEERDQVPKARKHARATASASDQGSR